MLSGWKLALEELENKERRILRKILGPTKDEKVNYVLRSNKELHEFCPKITDEIRKRRVTFYGHLERMNEDRLIKKIKISSEIETQTRKMAGEETLKKTFKKCKVNLFFLECHLPEEVSNHKGNPNFRGCGSEEFD